MYYAGTLEEMNTTDAKIVANCPTGGFVNWDIPKETTTTGIYAITVPEGSHGYTREQMISGINDIEVETVEFPQEGE